MKAIYALSFLFIVCALWLIVAACKISKKKTPHYQDDLNDEDEG